MRGATEYADLQFAARQCFRVTATAPATAAPAMPPAGNADVPNVAGAAVLPFGIHPDHWESIN